jgi:hypothetical protein
VQVAIQIDQLIERENRTMAKKAAKKATKKAKKTAKKK